MKHLENKRIMLMSTTWWGGVLFIILIANLEHELCKTIDEGLLITFMQIFY